MEWISGWLGGGRLSSSENVVPLVFHSKDGGETWGDNLWKNIPQNTDVYQLYTVQSVSSNIAYVAGQGNFGDTEDVKIWNTIDGGTTWKIGISTTITPIPRFGRQFTSLLYISNTNVWVVGSNFTNALSDGLVGGPIIAKSVQGPALNVWEVATSPSSSSGFYNQIISAGENTLFVVGSEQLLAAATPPSSINTPRIWKSINKGASWTQTLPFPNPFPGSKGSFGSSVLSIVAKNPNELWANIVNIASDSTGSYTNIVRTLDGGVTWFLEFSQLESTNTGEAGVSAGTTGLALAQTSSCELVSTVIWSVTACLDFSGFTIASCNSLALLQRKYTTLRPGLVAPLCKFR